MNFQWYPGHMAKAKRLLQSQLSKVDLVIELCDARLPLSSRNPALNELVRHKRRILLLCKADLAENGKTQEWLAYFKSRGVEAMAYDATPGKTKQAKAFIASAAQAVVERGERRGMNKTVRAMVIGVPNVGKSTFINRLYGGSVTETGDRPGVTKGKQWVSTEKFDLLDMPGVLWKKFDSKTIASNLAFIGSIKDDILDVEELAMNLLDEVRRNYPELVAQRYKLDAETLALPPYELMEAIGRKRGLLVRGGEVNTERCAIMLVDEFRACKWGRISLERPPQRDDLADFAEDDDE